MQYTLCRFSQSVIPGSHTWGPERQIIVKSLNNKREMEPHRGGKIRMISVSLWYSVVVINRGLHWFSIAFLQHCRLTVGQLNNSNSIQIDAAQIVVSILTTLQRNQSVSNSSSTPSDTDYYYFFTHTVVLPGTCNQTLMCKIRDLCSPQTKTCNLWNTTKPLIMNDRTGHHMCHSALIV